MHRQPSPVASTVSNLVPVWGASDDGGGTYEPTGAAAVVEQAVHAEESGAARPRTMAAPERVAADDATPPRSSFSYDQLGVTEAPAPIYPEVDYDALERRDIAKQFLRARLVAIAEQREHRSAYEIVFIMLAAAVSVLLAAPPLVQVLLAAHGTQA